MEGNNFWLIYIQDNQVSASLISSSNNTYHVSSVGPQKQWDSNDSSVLVAAVDESLSVASLNANITEDQEPSVAAFVVPPFWISSDGKILPAKVKFIKDICKDLSLKPSGFLAEDEALVEESNQTDGFPASFILLHLSEHEFYLSLVYLGHIKERIKKGFDDEFTGQILESTLVELNSESALPPQIIIFGQADNKLLTSLKDFPWVGKKNIETFLHFPDIKLYSISDIVGIFTKVISIQLGHTPKISINNETSSGIDEAEIVDDDNTVDSTVEVQTDDLSDDLSDQLPPKEAILVETDAQDLGFSVVESNNHLDNLPIFDSIPEPNLDPFEPPIMSTPPVFSEKNKIKFNPFNKIKFPKFNFNHNIFWIILIILPFLAIIPFLFVKSQITLFITPYQFNKTIPITLKVDASADDLNQSIIPVTKQSFEVDAKATVETTGQKTVGDKAKGEIIVYNKVDKAQNIPKGAILTDSAGKKYELTTAVSVAASSSNLDQGVITLGQTKTVAIATDIGSEFNITVNTQLKFKDYSDTSLIAKVDTAFAGGSRQQIRAVSQEDKNNVQTKIDEEISKNVDTKVSQTLGTLSGIIKETIQSKKDNLEISREVGEAADQLVGTVTASVTVFTLSPESKTQIINHFLSSEADFNNIEFNPENFDLAFKINKTDASQATGTLTISGKSLPKINTAQLQKSLTVKTINQGSAIIKKMVPRAYNFHIGTNLPLLPFRPENINIEVKTESL